MPISRELPVPTETVPNYDSRDGFGDADEPVFADFPTIDDSIYESMPEMEQEER